MVAPCHLVAWTRIASKHLYIFLLHLNLTTQATEEKRRNNYKGCITTGRHSERKVRRQRNPSARETLNLKPRPQPDPRDARTAPNAKVTQTVIPAVRRFYSPRARAAPAGPKPKQPRKRRRGSANTNLLANTDGSRASQTCSGSADYLHGSWTTLPRIPERSKGYGAFESGSGSDDRRFRTTLPRILGRVALT